MGIKRRQPTQIVLKNISSKEKSVIYEESYLWTGCIWLGHDMSIFLLLVDVDNSALADPSEMQLWLFMAQKTI